MSLSTLNAPTATLPEGPLPFQTWIQEQLARHQWSYRELETRMRAVGAKGGPNAISLWVNGSTLPQPEQEIALAAVTSTPLETLTQIVWQSRRLKAARKAVQLDERKQRASEIRRRAGSAWNRGSRKSAPAA